jgi:protein required for attachment to host cells
MKKIWVVVADEAIARILEWPETGDELVPVEELTDPDAHASGADMRRDAQGRRSGSAPQGSKDGSPHRLRGSASVTSSAGEGEQHQEAGDFARRVAGQLSQALRDRRFEELRIAAAPRFLGLLRKALAPEVAAAVTDELDKDLIHMQNADITRRLFPQRTKTNEAS